MSKRPPKNNPRQNSRQSPRADKRAPVRQGQKSNTPKAVATSQTQEQRPQKPRSFGGRPAPQRLPGGAAIPSNANLIYGVHAVKAALENPKRTCHTLLMSDAGAIKLGFGDGNLPSFGKLVAPRELDIACPEDAVHQGAVLIAAPLNTPTLEQLEGAQLVLVLDQVTDPHNVGAILRSASALNVDALIMTERHSAPLDGVTAKTASGGVEHTPVCFVSNLASAITDLRDLGFFTVGLDSEGDDDLAALPLSAPLALVLGAEGKGLRRLTRERCDALARIDMPGAIKSLNVSNAALLSLYIARSKLG